jgi:hypothetical protein
MLKCLVAPLLLITMNAKKPIENKYDFENSARFIEKVRTEEKAIKTKLFVQLLEHQLLYEPVEISYSLSSCFSFSYYKMTITKNGQEYVMKLIAVRAPDMDMAEEKFLHNKGDRISVKLTNLDLENLKRALTQDKRRTSTVHNYVLIKQGNAFYELMDDNPDPPLLSFLEALQKKAMKLS